MSFLVFPYSPTKSVSATTTDTVEFVVGAPDAAFGRCSSSNNYTLPESQQVFSNSGFSIDEKGLYLSPADSQNRLILWDYQYAFEQFKKISWYFFNDESSTTNVNLFGEILSQKEVVYRKTYRLQTGSFIDAVSVGSYNTISFSGISFDEHKYKVWELNFEDRMVRHYNSNPNYSVKSFLGEFQVSFFYQGILSLGWHGVGNNKSQRLRKIEVKKYN